MTLAPIHLRGPAAMRAGWRLLRDPITAMQQNHAEFGRLIVISDLLPFTRNVKLAALGLPLILAAGPEFNNEVLGNPEAFHRTLTDLGANLCAFRTYPDHHAYTRADVEELRHWVRGHAEESIVVTTQKDLVKLRLARLGDRELWALRISLSVVAGQERLATLMRSVLMEER